MDISSITLVEKDVCWLQLPTIKDFLTAIIPLVCLKLPSQRFNAHDRLF